MIKASTYSRFLGVYAWSRPSFHFVGEAGRNARFRFPCSSGHHSYGREPASPLLAAYSGSGRTSPYATRYHRESQWAVSDNVCISHFHIAFILQAGCWSCFARSGLRSNGRSLHLHLSRWFARLLLLQQFRPTFFFFIILGRHIPEISDSISHRRNVSGSVGPINLLCAESERLSHRDGQRPRLLFHGQLRHFSRTSRLLQGVWDRNPGAALWLRRTLALGKGGTASHSNLIMWVILLEYSLLTPIEPCQWSRGSSSSPAASSLSSLDLLSSPSVCSAIAPSSSLSSSLYE